jgi:hypothetical protein
MHAMMSIPALIDDFKFRNPDVENMNISIVTDGGCNTGQTALGVFEGRTCSNHVYSTDDNPHYFRNPVNASLRKLFNSKDHNSNIVEVCQMIKEVYDVSIMFTYIGSINDQLVKSCFGNGFISHGNKISSKKMIYGPDEVFVVHSSMLTPREVDKALESLSNSQKDAASSETVKERFTNLLGAMNHCSVFLNMFAERIAIHERKGRL